MSRLKARIDAIAAASTSRCVLSALGIYIGTAIAGWTTSFIILYVYALALGGLFRGSHPAEEPRIWLFGIVIPAVVTLGLLLWFGLALAAVLRRHHQHDAILGVYAAVILSSLTFLAGVAINMVLAFS